MQKQELLQQISALAGRGEVSQMELAAAYEAGTRSNRVNAAMANQLKLGHILYYIGGAVVFLGIAVLLAEHWQELSQTTRMLASLGAAIAAYVVGWLLERDERTVAASPAFSLLSALTLPIGLYVLCDQLKIDVASNAVQSIMAAIACGVFALSYWRRQQLIFLLFTIAFGTWLYFSLTSWALQSAALQTTGLDLYEYQAMLAGLVYLILGYWFRVGKREPLTGVLFGFGALGLLGAGLGLASTAQTWDFVYPGLVAAVLFASVRLRSTALLVMATMFLMFYILQVTYQYFASSLGWPLALVLAGLVMVGTGYAASNLKRAYWGSTKTLASPKA